jgi:hypothetical protein
MRNAPDNGDAVRKNYWLGQYADELPQINGALAALAFNEPLSENATSTDRVAEECVSRKRHLEKLLGISEISERSSTRKVTRQEIEDAKKIPKNVR